MGLKFLSFPVRGIDISVYDKWLIVSKLLGKVHFAIVRIGHGTKTDSLFKEFWSLLKRTIFRLAYFYMDYYSNHMPDQVAVYGIDDYEWGVVQGKNAWNNLKEDNDCALVFLDIENGNPDYAPDINSVWERVEKIADGFFDTYDSLSNITNGIYASLSMFKQFSPRFRHRPAYVALYDDYDDNGVLRTRESVIKEMRDAGWTGPILFWQYASDGDVDDNGVGDGLSYGLGRPVMDLDVWMDTEYAWEEFKRRIMNTLLDIAPIGQRDPRWAHITLGTSNTTIGGQGCVITSISMLLTYYKINMTPDKLNDILNACGGYHNGNLFVWQSLEIAFPGMDFRYRYDGSALDKINEQLALKKPVIIHVDHNPATSYIDEHWVLVIGKVDGSYIINDPWDKKQIKFEDRYGDPKTNILHVCTYDYTPPEPEEPLEPLYKIRVKPGITRLVIRSGPSKTSPVVHKYASGEYEVYKEENGYGMIDSYRWIALEYTDRVDENVIFRVQINTGITKLLIRSGPGKEYSVVEKYAKGQYDVYEEKNGYYRIGSYRWICGDPDYVTKIAV